MEIRHFHCNDEFFMRESKGVLYIATGEKYRDEACRSAESLKAQMPDLPVTIMTNAPVDAPVFNQVIIIPTPYYGYSDKVQQMYSSPYELTLFLDTDTYVCDDISEMFILLERFDMAAAHAPFRFSSIDAGFPKDYLLDGIPDSFPEMNTGVVLFKKSPRVARFFATWVALQQDALKCESNPPDQVSFRQALFESELRLATLTPEYNCRFIAPTFVCGTVKILHGQHSELPFIARQINAERVARLFLQWDIYRQCELWHQWAHLQDEVMHIRTAMNEFKKSTFWKMYRLLNDLKHLMSKRESC